MNLLARFTRRGGGGAAVAFASACLSTASILASAPAAAVSPATMGLLSDVTGTVTNTVGTVTQTLSTRDAVTAAGGVAPPAINKNTGAQIPNGSVLLLWTADGCASVTCNPQTAQDFLAVVDAEPNSRTYGNVIWTAELPKVLASNVAGNITGLLASDSHNDPHHMLAYTSYISDGSDGLVKGRKYTFAGGVISKNVFRYDITSVRSIKKAEIAVCGTQPRRSSLTDDFVVMPSNGGGHKIMFTYMSNYVYGPGGTVTEIDPGRTAPQALGGCLPSAPAPVPLLENVKAFGLIANLGLEPDDSPLLGHKGITEYSGSVRADQPRNPTQYTSSPDTRATRSANQGLFFLGNKDAGLEAVPHGMGLTYDGKYLATSDYAVAASIGAAAINGALGELCGGQANGGLKTDIGPLGICGSSFGSSVRVWETSGTYTKDKTRDSLKPANVYAGNPYLRSVSAVPDGPRVEPILIHEENEGLMAFGLPHQSHHCAGQKGWVHSGDVTYDTAVSAAGVSANAKATKTAASCKPGDADYIPHKGAFTASMCGGVLFYSPDITVSGSQTNAFGGKGPYWRAVYDVGPCTGVSYFSITDDDRFLIQPISGIESPKSIDAAGSIDFDRDYPREHSRRVLTVDIRPLLNKGLANTNATKIQCDYPQASASRAANTTLGLKATRADKSGGVSKAFNVLKHNNEAEDCPRIRGAIGQFETGPNGVGLATTVSSNSSQLGTGYVRLAETVTQIRAGNPTGIFLSPAQTGGEPSGTGGTPGSGNLNTLQNLYTHGGPHFTGIDRVGYQQTTSGQGGYKNLTPLNGLPRNEVDGKPAVTGTDRYVFIQYFVELQHVPLPGTGSDGDRTVCLGKVDRTTGATVLDTSFTDELLGTPCLDFDSAARDAWFWPGERGAKGGAKPHSAIFERDGAPLFGPGYFPAKPLDPDGPL